MVFPGGGEIFNRFAEVAAIELGSALAGRAYQNDGEAGFEGHRHQRGFPKSRDAFNADVLGIDSGIGFQIIQSSACAPSPGTKRSPIIGLAWLTFVDESNDSLG